MNIYEYYTEEELEHFTEDEIRKLNGYFIMEWLRNQ